MSVNTSEHEREALHLETWDCYLPLLNIEFNSNIPCGPVLCEPMGASCSCYGAAKQICFSFFNIDKDFRLFGLQISTKLLFFLSNERKDNLQSQLFVC